MKTLIIDAICGVGFPSMIVASECEKLGLATFTGDQHNPEWQWSREALAGCRIETLEELYGSLRTKREQQAAQSAQATAPQAENKVIICQ